MGKKSGPDTPDYTGAANAQAAASQANTTQQTWANRPNQTSPFGSVSWNANTTTDPSTGQQVTQWTQNTSLDPRIQGALDSQLATQQGRSDLANSMMGNVRQDLGQRQDYSQYTPLAGTPQAQNTGTTTSANGFNFGAQNIDTTRQISPIVDQSRQEAQAIDTTRQQAPTLNTNMGANAGAIQGQLDFSGAQQVGSAADTRQRAENAAYQAQTARLDQRFNDQQQALETDLANRGISRNSAAYTRAMNDFERSRNDAYSQAQLAAINIGGTEAQRDYGMDMGLRQQQVNEAGLSGNFANNAQAQGFGQNLQAGQANNSALLGGYGANLQGQQQQLAAQNAAFGQESQARQQQLAAQNQAFNFGNTSRQTQLGAQQQAFGQDLAMGNYGLAQQQQAFGQNLQANNQNYQQQMQNANYQNQLRQQQIAEGSQQRTQGLNEMNALLNGQTVSNPQFQNFGQSGVAQSPDYINAMSAQYQGQLNQQSNRNAFTGDLVGGIAQGLGYYFSDRRVKRNVRRIGTHPRGFGIYRYRYVGERGTRVGVIAQEVRRFMPEAVRVNSGVLMVNYAALN